MVKRIIYITFLIGCVSVVWSQNDSTVTLTRSQYEGILQRLNALENQAEKSQKRMAKQNQMKENDTTITTSHASKGRLQLGGYGEITMHRFFYSNEFTRYAYPEQYKNVPSRGQFDLPHVVFTVAYDFGKGWKMSAEVEFEHGGTGTTIEIEEEEFGEYEQEVEKGGEIALEQFWLEKSFAKWANLRIGHIIVPIGLTNQFHLPTEFFSVLRPEEENTILPLTWHETGVSFWGRAAAWRYELQFLAGLDAERFSNSGWIKDGAVSPYEFSLGNSYALAARVDNYSVKGLRMAVSGYYGHSAANSLKSDRYKDITGRVMIGSFDACYKDYGVLTDISVVYGHLTDSKAISIANKNMPKGSPSPRTNVASDALSFAFNVGYDIFHTIKKLHQREMKFYLFAHFGYVNSMFATAEGISKEARFDRHIVSGGINFYPIKNLVIKAEFASRMFFNLPYNTENTFSIGAAYSGMFTN
ncbi:MAG: hypothetical protein LBR36_08270 [Bacteroidales bacterium]|jgi:hypothetical protein|nr:hypothetical protein [Bacteroidales bacterium]